jgi:hypothetical protein
MEQVKDRSAEYARDVKAAEVGETAPVETPEHTGNLSGGELNQGPVRS